MAFLDLIVSAETRRIHQVNAAVTPECQDLAAIMYGTVGQVCSQPPALCDLEILGVLSLWTCSIYSMSLEAVSELVTQLSTSLRHAQGDAPDRTVLNAPAALSMVLTIPDGKLLSS